MNSIYFVVDEGLSDVASAQALHIAKLWGCDVHIFVERRDANAVVDEIAHRSVFYHYDELMPLLPLGLPGDKKWPNIVYLRLFAPALLKGYRRLIYLDADIHCLKADLSIWDVPLPSGLGMVSDFATTNRAPHDLKTLSRVDWLKTIGVQSGNYANSGFLLIDPALFLQHDYAALLPQYFAEYPAAARFDQDFLNHLFDGLWTEIGPRFNFQAHLLELGVARATDPVFVHFCRKHKPWWGQSDNWFSPTDVKYTQAYDRVFIEAGLDPARYRRPMPMKAERRIKYRVYHWLSRRGFRVPREQRELAAWRQKQSDFLAFMNDGLSRARFADETRVALAEGMFETPIFDGRLMRTWQPTHLAG